MSVIFLDTEYTSSGEIAQLAYLAENSGQCRAKNFYFRVREMDEGSFRVHGLSLEFLERTGVRTEEVRGEILEDFRGATLAAHNLNADLRVLRKAFGELGSRWGMCTMYRFARVLRLPGGRPYKNPSLNELAAHYEIPPESIAERAEQAFGCTGGAHDARYDAAAVELCVREAIRRGDCRDLFAAEGKEGKTHGASLESGSACAHVSGQRLRQAQGGGDGSGGEGGRL